MSVAAALAIGLDPLDAARRARAAAGVRSYDLVLTRSCFCPATPPVRVAVRDGVVTDVAGTLRGSTDARGVPTRIEIDHVKNAIDDEEAITVSVTATA